MSRINWHPHHRHRLTSSISKGLPDLYNLYIQHTLDHPVIYHAIDINLGYHCIESTAPVINKYLDKCFNKLPWSKLFTILHKIESGLAFLHQYGLSHNNLKLCNIALSGDQPILTHFVASKFLPAGDWISYARCWLKCLDIHELAWYELNILDIQRQIFLHIPADLSESENSFLLDNLPLILLTTLSGQPPPNCSACGTLKVLPFHPSQSVSRDIDQLARRFFPHFTDFDIKQAEYLFQATLLLPELFTHKQHLPLVTLWVTDKMQNSQVIDVKNLVQQSESADFCQTECQLVYGVSAILRNLKPIS